MNRQSVLRVRFLWGVFVLLLAITSLPLNSWAEDFNQQAAVTWVVYPQGDGFRENPDFIKGLFVGPKSIWNIPEEHYFLVPSGAGTYDDFIKNVDKALHLLKNQEKPKLYLQINSHGLPGMVCYPMPAGHSDRPQEGLQHQRLVQDLLNRFEQFEKGQREVKLRVQIMYDACYAESLTKTLEKLSRQEEGKKGRQFQIDVFTSSSVSDVAWHHRFWWLLELIHRFNRQPERARGDSDYFTAADWPLLTEFEWLLATGRRGPRSLGQGLLNTHQVWSSYQIAPPLNSQDQAQFMLFALKEMSQFHKHQYRLSEKAGQDFSDAWNMIRESHLLLQIQSYFTGPKEQTALLDWIQNSIQDFLPLVFERQEIRWFVRALLLLGQGMPTEVVHSHPINNLLLELFAQLSSPHENELESLDQVDERVEFLRDIFTYFQALEKQDSEQDYLAALEFKLRGKLQPLFHAEALQVPPIQRSFRSELLRLFIQEMDKEQKQAQLNYQFLANLFRSSLAIQNINVAKTAFQGLLEFTARKDTVQLVENFKDSPIEVELWFYYAAKFRLEPETAESKKLLREVIERNDSLGDLARKELLHFKFNETEAEEVAQRLFHYLQLESNESRILATQITLELFTIKHHTSFDSFNFDNLNRNSKILPGQAYQDRRLQELFNEIERRPLPSHKD